MPLLDFMGKSLDDLLAGALSGDGVADAVFELENALRERQRLWEFLALCRRKGLNPAELEKRLERRLDEYEAAWKDKPV